jgi:putative transposase
MKRSKFSGEQVAYALRHVGAGTPVGDVCRQPGVSEATFYAWKKKYAHLGVSKLRRLRELEDENGRLKRLGRRSHARQAHAVAPRRLGRES